MEKSNKTLIGIVAVDENMVIGDGNKLIWHLPNDLKRFKKLTMGYPMLMGRKTFESLGPNPLPKRDHIVVSTQVTRNSEKVYWFQSIDNALQKAQELNDTIYVIGGGEVFKQTMDKLDVLEITRVHHSFEGSVYFPPIDFSSWELIFSESHPADDKHDYPYTFETYKRVNR